MKYEKPEIALLGAAINAVQSCPDKAGQKADSSGGCGTGRPHSGAAAYEADE
jgi:hypothetical protein